MAGAINNRQTRARNPSRHLARGRGRREGVLSTDDDVGRHRNRLKRSEEHTSELQSPDHLVCRLLLEKKKATDRAAGPGIATDYDLLSARHARRSSEHVHEPALCQIHDVHPTTVLLRVLSNITPAGA